MLSSKIRAQNLKFPPRRSTARHETPSVASSSRQPRHLAPQLLPDYRWDHTPSGIFPAATPKARTFRSGPLCVDFPYSGAAGAPTRG